MLHLVARVLPILLLAAPDAWPDQFVVEPSANLQNVIDQALGNDAPNDTIFLKPGTYDGPIAIDYTGTVQTSLTLARTTSESPLVDGGIVVTNASRVKLVGLRIDSPHGDGIAAIRVIDSTSVGISFCYGVTGDDGGIDAIDSRSLAINDCSFTGMKAKDGDGGFGIRIVGGSEHVVRDSVLKWNERHGVLVEANGTSITNCNVTGNGTAGATGAIVVVGLRNGVRDCTVKANDGAGIEAKGTCSVRKNAVIANGDDGIRLGDGGVEPSYAGDVRDNHVKQNGGAGIRIKKDQHGSVAAGNVVSGNVGAGIRVSGTGHLIEKNKCSSTEGGGAGILIASESSDNCLMANKLAGNAGDGISVEGSGNLLVENSATGNDGIVEAAAASGNVGHSNTTHAGFNDFP